MSLVRVIVSSDLLPWWAQSKMGKEQPEAMIGFSANEVAIMSPEVLSTLFVVPTIDLWRENFSIGSTRKAL